MLWFLKLISALFSSLFAFLVIGLSGLAGIYLYYSPQLPDPQSLRQIELQVPLRIYSSEEKLIAEYGGQRSRPIKLHEIPEKLRQAFIAIEDSRYYEHPGIDIIGVARALRSVVSTGHASQGASTITMQLARNTFLDNDKTISRKLRETLLAIRMEQTLTKDEILELYLNKIYLGNRAYGIAAAAETYYGKQPLENLSLAQMAMLAGLPKAPSRYNPIANPSRSMIRRDYILKRMQELGFIDRADYEQAVREPNTATVHKPDIQVYAPYVAEMVRQAIVEKYADKAYTQGYHVYTTLDAQFQSYAATALRQTLDEYDQRHGYRGPEDQLNLDDFTNQEELLDKLSTYPIAGDLQPALVLSSTKQQAEVLLLDETTTQFKLADVTWARSFINSDRRGPTPKRVNDVLKAGDIIRVRPLKTDSSDGELITQWQFTQIPTVGGALVLMDPQNGAIRAVMGGYDFEYSKFNRATQAMRQPGSSFKPILYAAAVSKGFTPASVVNDAPITIPGSKWQPKNFGGKFIGPTTLREALAKSRNLVSIRLLRDIGINYTIEFAERFGYQRQNLPPNLTLALGTGVTTPVQMATAYASFANGGFKVDAHFIKRIEDNEGNVLFDAHTTIRHVCGDEIETCPAPNATDPTVLTADATSSASTSDSHLTTLGAAGAEAHSDAKAIAEATVIDPVNLVGSPAAPRILDSQTAAYMISMLQDVTRYGTAASAGKALKREDIAGKTGTTNDERDSWFCGFTPDYVAVAWSGFDDMARLGDGETSTRVAVPMWIRLMQAVLKDSPVKAWQSPEKLRKVKIDAHTGLLADEYSTEIIEQTLQPGQATPRKATHFEFTDTRVTPLETVDPTIESAPPKAPKRRKEAVEIPEQIF